MHYMACCERHIEDKAADWWRVVEVREEARIVAMPAKIKHGDL